MTISTNERLWSPVITTDSIKYSKTHFTKCPERIDSCIRRLWNEGLLAEQSWSQLLSLDIGTETVMGEEGSSLSAAVIVNAASLNTSGCSSTHGNDTWF